jgi:hypothetical protein
MTDSHNEGVRPSADTIPRFGTLKGCTIDIFRVTIGLKANPS